MWSSLRFRFRPTTATRAPGSGVRCGRLPPATALAFALLLAGAWSPAAEAQDRPGEPEQATSELVGIVLDHSSGEPVHHATVFLPARSIGFLTREDGSFEIPNLPSGEHTVEVQRLGYRTATMQVEVTDPPRPLEFRIVPEPVILEGLEIVSNRFERRRRATTMSSRVFELDDLLTSPATTMRDFLAGRAMVSIHPCPPQMMAFDCVRVRGRFQAPSVYVDEIPLMGGLDQLAAWSPQDFQMVEVYGWGRHIRAYTHNFMERAARTRLAPLPIWF